MRIDFQSSIARYGVSVLLLLVFGLVPYFLMPKAATVRNKVIQFAGFVVVGLLVFYLRGLSVTGPAIPPKQMIGVTMIEVLVLGLGILFIVKMTDD